MKIRLNDEEVEVEPGISIAKLCSQLSLNGDFVAAKIQDKLVDLSHTLTAPCEIRLLTPEDHEGLDVVRHSASHVMAQAILRLFPTAKLTIGPVVENGFYYDIYLEQPLKEPDLARIEKEMQKIIEEDQPFERIEMPKQKALELYRNNKYKQEILNELTEPTVSVYDNRKTTKSTPESREFFDLCTGPHVPSTRYIRAFKLTKIAGAYWRGNAKNDQLQRVYGVCFATKKELEDYLKQLEEAEKRDHRKLAKELKLFMFSDMAPGMVFYLPRGMIIRNELEKWIREELERLDYQEIRTPIILNEQLWHTSGHWDHYKDNMYFTNIDEQSYAIKPMNCPGALLVYKSSARSYRELPLRFSEFGLVHRHELSGVLSGMFRVRAFTQDDGHIIAMPEQIEEEVSKTIGMIERLVELMGFEYTAELSTRPENYMGDLDTWNLAEKALENCLKKLNKPYKINEGDGAFYGPKIDFKVKDAIGRIWQLSTIQLDFQMPRRFDITYEGKDGKQHTPVMIHRAILGSFERFLGIITEHFAGKFPVWLSPIQVALLPINDNSVTFALALEQRMKKEGVRTYVNQKSETINAKVRDAQLEKIPYILVIGSKEQTTGILNVRDRNGKQYQTKIEDFIEKVKNLASSRSREL